MSDTHSDTPSVPRNPWVSIRPIGSWRKATRPRVARTVSRDATVPVRATRSEEHTSELQSLAYLVCRLLLEKKKKLQPLSINLPFFQKLLQLSRTAFLISLTISTTPEIAIMTLLFILFILSIILY